MAGIDRFHLLSSDWLGCLVAPHYSFVDCSRQDYESWDIVDGTHTKGWIGVGSDTSDTMADTSWGPEAFATF